MSRPRPPASGWLDPDPFKGRRRAVQEALDSRTGPVPFSEIERAAAWYLLSKATVTSSMAPTDVRALAAAVRRDAVALHAALCALAAQSSGYRLTGSQAHITAVGDLAVAAQQLEMEIPKGRPVAPVTVLVRELAAILRAARLPLTTKDNDPLVQCVGAVLEGLGEVKAPGTPKVRDGKWSDVRKLVVDAMRGRTKPSPSNRDLSEQT